MNSSRASHPLHGQHAAQQRRSRRVPVHGRVDHLQFCDAGDWRAAPAGVTNVSKNGLQLVVAEPVPVGATVRLDRAIPAGAGILGGRWHKSSGRLHEEGRVVHVRQDADEPSRYWLGVALPPSAPAFHDRTAVRALFLGVALLLWYSFSSTQAGAENALAGVLAIGFVLALGVTVELHHVLDIRSYPHRLAAWKASLEEDLRRGSEPSAAITSEAIAA